MEITVILFVLAFVLASAKITHAATWQCRWCGMKQSAPNKPAAMSNCPKNPRGKHHMWVKIS